MNRVSDVVARAARRVTPVPARQQQMQALAQSLLVRTNKAAARYGEARDAVLGGSFAKGTWLDGHVDIDIFVRLDPATPERRFEEVGLAIGAAATRGFPRGKKFAQHPYTEALVRGVKVNVVPCYDVAQGGWRSAADRSPFHTALVRALSEPEKTEVRLLKRFMIGVGVYGAEIETKGFSGYVAEVIVMKAGSFERAVRHFAGFRFHSDDRPFSLPDPVDETRDLGVAVAGDKLGTMILAARGFLSNPTGAYFREMHGRENPPLRGRVVALAFEHKRLSEDTLWGELRRATRHLVRHLEMHGFRIARSLAASDNESESAILLIPEYDTLPELEQRVGPTVDRRDDLKAFIASGGRDSKLVWVDEDGRARLLRQRKHTVLTELLKTIANGETEEIGLPREMERGIRRSGRVITGARLRRAESASKWLEDGVREIVSDAFGSRDA